MTTSTVTTVVDQTTDAAFRTWVAEFIAQLLAVGLTQTADTGQINTATVTRAAINSDAGYAVFRFNDTQQGTAPIFFKVFFGSGSAQTIPRIRVQQGTASNGSGTVSGLGSANTDIVSSSGALLSTITTYPSYFCYADGFFGFGWKVGSTAANQQNAAFGIQRLVDSSGANTSDGSVQMWSTGSQTWNARTLVYGTSTIFGSVTNTQFLLIHYGVSTSLVSGVPQSYKAYAVTPKVRPLEYSLAVINAECAVGTQFTGTPIGLTSRNYINVGLLQSSNYGMGMLWE